MPANRRQVDETRLVAVWEQALAAAGVDTTTPGLMAALAHARLDVRAGAALLLGRCGCRDALPALRALLEDSSSMVRIEAAMSLALMDDCFGLPVLVATLGEDLDDVVPIRAAGYLATLGDPRGLEIVREALRSSLVGTRLAAAVALKRFLSYHTGDASDGKLDLLEVIQEALQDPDPQVRGELIHKLAALDDSRVAGLLSQVYDSDPDEDVRTAAEALLSAGVGRPGVP